MMARRLAGLLELDIVDRAFAVAGKPVALAAHALRVVADVDVSGASEPRLVSSDNLRAAFRRGNL